MKIITTEEAVQLIKDGDMVGLSGSGGFGSPENLLIALRKRYEKEGVPRNIGVTCGIIPSNLTRDYVGINNLAIDGLATKAISSHLGRGILFGEMIGQNKIEAYAIPLGVYGHLLRAIAGKKEGILTHVGLNTFCDPRIDGCKYNSKCQEEIVSLVNINGKEQLFYKSFPIHVALIKATYSDKDGNISLIHEPVIGEQLELASAVHACGGTVIVEVEKIVDSIKPKEVNIFKKFVDYVVVTSQNKELGDYNFPIYRPELIGEGDYEFEKVKPIPLNERKICVRRASLELKEDDIVNLGIGMPDGVGQVAIEENFYDKIILSIETGVFGGVPVYGNSFGAAIHPIALYKTTDMFDIYDGGIIDMAVLGLAEVDQLGNVNVSKLQNRASGPGGFINITQSTQNIILIGSFTSGGLEVEVKDGKLTILQEGKYRKFRSHVDQITLASKYALEHQQHILYVTERAVFTLKEEGLTLIEIAPGIDLEKDIVANMDFRPIVSKDLKLMDERIFFEQKMGLVLKK